MSNRLESKVALVTGGTTGIGLATAVEFAREGAKVFITGRRQLELEKAAALIGRGVTAVKSDASDLNDLDQLYAAIKDTTGYLDIVFANAGGGDMLPLGEITEKHFDRIFRNNVKGILFTVQKALPLLRDNASIILTSSTTSIMGTGSFSVYSASKAAIRNFARSWILDLKGRNIRVNAISPGPVRTPGLEGLIPPEHTEDLLESLASLVPMGRLGTPDEIAKAVLFLASSDSSFVNGAELFVDGGFAQV